MTNRDIASIPQPYAEQPKRQIGFIERFQLGMIERSLVRMVPDHYHDMNGTRHAVVSKDNDSNTRVDLITFPAPDRSYRTIIQLGYPSTNLVSGNEGFITATQSIEYTDSGQVFERVLGRYSQESSQNSLSIGRIFQAIRTVHSLPPAGS